MLQKIKLAWQSWLARVLSSGIQAHLFALIAVALLPLILLLGVISYQRYETRLTQARQTEVEVARGVASTFAAYVEGVQQQNYAIGQAIINDSSYNQADATHLLATAAAHSPAVRNISWVSPQGIVLASNQKDAVGRNISERYYYKMILAGKLWVVGDLTETGAVVNAPTLGIATAVREETESGAAAGELRGLVVAVIEPDRLGQLILTQQRPADGSFAIFDRQGVLVYSSPETNLTWQQRINWQQEDPVLQRAIHTGQEQSGISSLELVKGEWISARVPVAETGFYAGACRPVQVALLQVQNSLIDDALIALLVAGAAYLLAALLSRTISYPLARLERDARAMGEGEVAFARDLHAPAEVSSLRGTVEQMAAGLNQRAEALRESRERVSAEREWFRITLSSIGDAVITCDAQGAVTFLNPVAEELTGWTSQEAAGQPLEQVFVIIHEQTCQPVENPARKVMESGRVIGLANHTALIARDGRVIPIEDSAAPITDSSRPAGAAGQVLGVVIVFHDVSEQRKAEEASRANARALQESEERFRSLFHNRHSPMLLIEPVTGRIVEANPAASLFYGWSIAELEAMKISDLNTLPADQTLQNLRTAQSSASSEKFLFTHRLSSGETREVEVHSGPIRIAGKEYLFSIVQDITERKQAEDSLRASEAHLRASEARLREAHERAAWLARFPDENPNPVLRVSAEGTVLYRNPAAAQMPGWTCEAGGLPPEPFLALVRQAMAEQRVVHEDVPLAGRFYAVSAMPFPQENYTNLYGRDVTKRRQAEEALRLSEARLRRLVDANIIGVVIRDTSGQIKDANGAFLNLLGFTREEARSGKIHTRNLVPEEFQPLETRLVAEVLANGASQAYEKEYIHKDGHRVPILIGYTRLEGTPEDLIGFVLDLTELKKAQAELSGYAERLKRSNQELEQFAFVASHDLQEPLRKIKLFGDSLQKQLEGDLPEKARDYLTRMMGAAERMQEMVNSLLDLSRVNTRGGNFEITSLSGIVEDAVSNLEARVQASQGKVIIGELPTAEVDVLQFRQLFQNLIGNALKFHRPDVPPIVRVNAALIGVGRAPTLLITVEDNGIGFDEQYNERIFQPFQRLHGRSEFEGTGMGLAICQKIVERHHGKIEAHSTPGVGSTFTVVLPVRQGE